MQEGEKKRDKGRKDKKTNKRRRSEKGKRIERQRYTTLENTN